MPIKAKELSSIEVRRLTKKGRHSVGGVTGLYLMVSSENARSWILRIIVGSKRREIGLGGFPDVTLAQARELAREMRLKVVEGIDPVEERLATKKALIERQRQHLAFKDAAYRCFDAKKPEFSNAKHATNWIGSLEKHAIPIIGNVPVHEIDLPHILSVLEPIWKTKTETASRVRQRIEVVLTWATVSKYRSGDNPARWAGNLKELLPTPSKIKVRGHHKALPWQDVPTFIAELKTKEGTGARALEFLIGTAARSGEVRNATWEEIDFEQALWTVPGERMKARKTHRVPLTNTMVKLLKSLPRQHGSNFIFTAPRGGALSDMSIAAVCKRAGIDATPHGFRSSFKDWARNCTSYADEISELALAHVSSDATRAAYARDELLDLRRQLMNDWDNFQNEN